MPRSFIRPCVAPSTTMHMREVNATGFSLKPCVRGGPTDTPSQSDQPHRVPLPFRTPLFYALMRGVWVQPLRRERARPLHGRCTAVRNLPRPYNHGHHGPRRRTHGEACGHAKFLLKSLLILIGVRLHLLWSNIVCLSPRVYRRGLRPLVWGRVTSAAFLAEEIRGQM
jgi:hypothetical protein